MNNELQIKILAVVKLLNDVEVKGHDNLVRVATAINELNNIAKTISTAPEKAEEA